jgi:hypothetical protein
MALEAIYENHLLPPQPWEFELAEKAGLTMSMLRFAIAFFMSVPIAIVFRRIPSVRGKDLQKISNLIILRLNPDRRRFEARWSSLYYL